MILLLKYELKDYEVPSVLVLLSYLAFLLIYSHLTYQYVEKPFRKKGRDMLFKIITTHH